MLRSTQKWCRRARCSTRCCWGTATTLWAGASCAWAMLPCLTLRFTFSFTSHFSRLALELMTARLGYVPPYSSIDKPYGMHGENMPLQLNEIIS